MARERMIYPDLLESSSTSILEPLARYLWVGLILIADDHGRGRGSPELIKARVFPTDSIQMAKIQTWLEEIEVQKMIVFYQVGLSLYYFIPNWGKFQHLRYVKKSMLPDPEGEESVILDKLASYPLPIEKYKSLVQKTPRFLPDFSDRTSAKEKRREEKMGKEKRSTSSSISQISVPTELSTLKLYRCDIRLCGKWSALLPEWRKAFPAVNIVQETINAHTWEVSNPTHQKTDRPRFLRSWFARVQQRGGTPGYQVIGGGNGDWREEYEEWQRASGPKKEDVPESAGGDQS